MIITATKAIVNRMNLLIRSNTILAAASRIRNSTKPPKILSHALSGTC